MSSSRNVKTSLKYSDASLQSDDSCFLDIAENDALLDHLDDGNDATKEPHEVPPCVFHNFLLGSCPTRINNVLQITKEIVDSGMPNRDCIKNPVGFLNTEVRKDKLEKL